MGIFEKIRRGRPSGDNSGDTELVDNSEVRQEVPDIEDTLDRLDAAITSPLEQDREVRGCGCWG